MPRMPLAIAVDVGGTSAKLALVTARARALASTMIPTGRQTRPRAFLHNLVAALGPLRAAAQDHGGRVVGMGIGVPGVVDPSRGVVRYLVNMPRWRQVPLQRWAERATGLPTIVDNDVKVMAWGEGLWGAGRGARSVFCMMLGTGVGGGILLDGRVHHGWSMSAGEIGHIPLAANGPACPCGGRGCLEQYVGTRAILALARRMLATGRPSLLRRLVGGDLRRITPSLIDQAAHRGDAVARAVWREVGERIGLALTTVANLLNPERIVIGGGIAKAGPLLLPTIRATVRARAMRGPAAVRIVPARWGAEAGVIGAAALVLNHHGILSRHPGAHR